MTKVRIDKWLWSIRIFKSRTLATHMCKSGSVKINDVKSKAASPVQVGDLISVQKNGFQFTFRAIKLLEKRVSATLAQQAYEDLTPEEELNKYTDWYIGKASPERRVKGAGRPTKRERRDLDAFKTDFYFADD